MKTKKPWTILLVLNSVIGGLCVLAYMLNIEAILLGTAKVPSNVLVYIVLSITFPTLFGVVISLLNECACWLVFVVALETIGLYFYILYVCNSVDVLLKYQAVVTVIGILVLFKIMDLNAECD